MLSEYIEESLKRAHYEIINKEESLHAGPLKKRIPKKEHILFFVNIWRHAHVGMYRESKAKVR